MYCIVLDHQVDISTVCHVMKKRRKFTFNISQGLPHHVTQSSLRVRERPFAAFNAVTELFRSSAWSRQGSSHASFVGLFHDRRGNFEHSSVEPPLSYIHTLFWGLLCDNLEENIPPSGIVAQLPCGVLRFQRPITRVVQWPQCFFEVLLLFALDFWESALQVDGMLHNQGPESQWPLEVGVKWIRILKKQKWPLFLDKIQHPTSKDGRDLKGSSVWKNQRHTFDWDFVLEERVPLRSSER